MPLLGLTNAQAKLAKFLIRAGTEIGGAIAGVLVNDLTASGDADPTTLEWRRVVFKYTRSTPAGTIEDKAQFKIDLVNVTSDEIDNTWTSTDNTNVLTPATAMVTALAPYVSPAYTAERVYLYRMRFNNVLDAKRPFADTGAPIASTGLLSTVGTASGQLPYQAAGSVTLKTAWAKHWGRVYLPTPGSAALDSYGRFTSTYRSGVGGAVKTFLGAVHDAGFYPVVPVGQINKQPVHGLLGITAVTVDDVPDVQRRRRPKQVLARTTA